MSKKPKIINPGRCVRCNVVTSPIETLGRGNKQEFELCDPCLIVIVRAWFRAFKKTATFKKRGRK